MPQEGEMSDQNTDAADTADATDDEATNETQAVSYTHLTLPTNREV